MNEVMKLKKGTVKVVISTSLVVERKTWILLTRILTALLSDGFKIVEYEENWKK
jgi:hypothetical protein